MQSAGIDKLASAVVDHLPTVTEGTDEDQTDDLHTLDTGDFEQEQLANKLNTETENLLADGSDLLCDCFDDLMDVASLACQTRKLLHRFEAEAALVSDDLAGQAPGNAAAMEAPKNKRSKNNDMVKGKKGKASRGGA